MDGLLALALLAIFLVVVAPIWALLGLSRLKRRVEGLEREVRDLRQQSHVPPDPVSPEEDVPTVEAGPEEARSEDMVAEGGTAPARAEDPWAAVVRDDAPELPAPKPSEPEDPAPPRRFVLTGERMGQLTAWLRENWIIAVAAISLALTGVFFVQYGVENGLLSPRLRVLSAIGLGLALIAGGEVLRRRLGDDHDLAAFLPSALSGAGLVAIFAAILAARQLYGLIGPTTAFAGMVAVAVAGIALGWFYGAFLTAFGILGATAAPFLVGGDSEDPWILMYYFALIAAAGLTVDALKRSAWISVIAVAFPSLAAWAIWAATPVGAQHLIGYGAVLALVAIVVPPLSLRPRHEGSMILMAAWEQGKVPWPEFPTRIAAAGMAIAIGFACLAAPTGVAEFWLSAGFLTVIIAASVFWLRHAPALDDLGGIAVVALLAIIAASGLGFWPATREWVTWVAEPEVGPPMTMTVLTGLGIVVSGVCAVAFFAGRHWAWGLGAAVFAPATFAGLDLYWAPLTHLSGTSWALHAMGVAAAMTLGAVEARRRVPATPLPAALFALAAMTMIGFAAIILLTKTALTLTFGVLAVCAAWLDRRYGLAPLTLFVKIAALACSFRLVVDPGVLWALEAHWLDMSAAYAGTIILLAVTWVILGQRERAITRMVVESVAATLIGIFASVALLRVLDDGTGLENHWSFSLFAMIWGISALGQLYRARAGFLRLRLSLAAIFAVLALMLLGLGVTVFNPVSGIFAGRVAGPPILDSLAVAYLLPALLCALAWRGFPELHRMIRTALIPLGSALAALWVGFEIRRLWRGPDLSQPGVTDGEMYSYTIALIALSAGLLTAALIRRSPLLRKLGLGAAALAVAKVFLLDASGLTGLTRVFSFLALGLALAGLAAVNRWIIRLQDDDNAKEAQAPASESDGGGDEDKP